jgi:hypothetical protein
MGYDVHITRAEDWTESESAPIGLDEWLRYVAGDHEMRLDNFAETEVGGDDVLRYENYGLEPIRLTPKLPKSSETSEVFRIGS